MGDIVIVYFLFHHNIRRHFLGRLRIYRSDGGRWGRGG